jgi:hypothetical protein
MTFRIYYSDGSFYDQDENSPMPVLDAQIIVQKDQDRGWITTHGADFFIRKGGRWWGVDLYGLFRFLMDTGSVLFGETIRHKEFDEIYQRAKAYKNEMAKGG